MTGPTIISKWKECWVFCWVPLLSQQAQDWWDDQDETVGCFLGQRTTTGQPCLLASWPFQQSQRPGQHIPRQTGLWTEGVAPEWNFSGPDQQQISNGWQISHNWIIHHQWTHLFWVMRKQISKNDTGHSTSRTRKIYAGAIQAQSSHLYNVSSKCFFTKWKNYHNVPEPAGWWSGVIMRAWDAQPGFIWKEGALITSSPSSVPL